MIPNAPKHRYLLALLALALITFGVYAPALDKYFLSESFPLIRHLAEAAPWQNLGETFTQSFINATFFGYYRPFLSLLIGLEYEMFGAAPFGYHLISVLIHVLNSLMVVRLTTWMLGRQQAASYVAGLIFGLYPLHPNGVLFIGAGANALATFFMLAAILAFLQFRDGEKRPFFFLSLLAFGLALGSYEAAVVLPALLALCDVAVNGWGWRLKERTLVYGPFFVLLALFFAFRLATFGSLAGANVDLIPHVLERIRLFPQILWRMVHPVYNASEGRQLAFLVILLLWLAVAGIGMVRRGKTAVLQLLFALTWIFLAVVVSLQVFVTLAEGRYWYLATVGLGMGVAVLVGPLSRKTFSPWLGGVALAVYFLVLLNQNVGTYQEAGRLTQVIQRELAEVGKTVGENGRFFVTEYPTFVVDEAVTLAQVYHWGLTDALLPPFSDSGMAVYPMFLGRETAVFADENTTFLRWQKETEQFIVVDKATDMPFIEVVYPPPDADVPMVESDMSVVFVAGPYEQFRLHVVTAANPLNLPLSRAQALTYESVEQRVASGELELEGLVGPVLATANPGDLLMAQPLPVVFMQDVYHLYNDEVYWWVEAMDERGEVVAHSPLMRFRMVEP